MGDSEHAASSKENQPQLNISLTYKSEKYDLTVDPNQTVLQLKEKIQGLTNVPMAMQKLICPKAQLKDEHALLGASGVASGARVMLVGNPMAEVAKANLKPTAEQLAADKAAPDKGRQPLVQRKEHRKILDKGLPDDAMPGLLGFQEDLPAGQCLRGMRNKHGAKLRLTFKLELDQLWIGTPEHTDKVPIQQIQAVVSEAITGQEHYSVVGIQLGPTEASRYWCYWVPSQYVAAIKRALS